jgi:hypothetical protein
VTRDIEGLFVGLMLGFMLGVLCSFCAWGFDKDEARTAAIEAGVAEYRVDPKTGETSFVFLKPCEDRK